MATRAHAFMVDARRISMQTHQNIENEHLKKLYGLNVERFCELKGFFESEDSSDESSEYRKTLAPGEAALIKYWEDKRAARVVSFYKTYANRSGIRVQT